MQFWINFVITTNSVGDEHDNNMPMTVLPIPPPPGQTIVMKINTSDVLCGRGGRINAHPGNVYFRTLVEQYKHKYCDPGTKNVDKARMASSIVYTIRNQQDAAVGEGGEGGRFLKEDQDSGFWVEIGDEKAIRKAAQALREMAPVLRHQTPPPPPPPDGRGKGGRGKGDPSGPGPRHRPGPPKREGLMNNSSNERRSKNRSPATATSSTQVLPDDKILDRMRNEYRKMESLQAEQTRRMQLLQDMELYEIQRSCRQSEGSSSSRFSNCAQTTTNDRYHCLHSSIEELVLTAREAIAALPLPSASGSGSNSSQSSHQEWDVQAEYLKMQALLIQRNQLAEKLSAQKLEGSSKSSRSERRGSAPQRQKEKKHHTQNKHNLTSSSSSSLRNNNPFNRQYSSTLGGDDHTMYTLSSTGSTTKSIDMSSLGGFTWSMWNNTNAVSNVNNNNNNSSGKERNISMASSITSCNSTLSSLERKLENSRQTQRCLEQKRQMQRMQQQHNQHQQQQRHQQKNLTVSMNSLGIDDDESFRVSNMEFSEMDMSCFSTNTTTTDHPSNSYSNILQEYVRGNTVDTTATSSRSTVGNNPTNTKAQQQQRSSMIDDDLLNASLKSLEISDNIFFGNTNRHDNMGANNNHGQQIHKQQQHHQQQPGVNQVGQHSSSSVHDMGISDVDFGISISSLKSIDVEYDDWLTTSQQTKGMESITELVNPWETEDDAAAYNKSDGSMSVRMIYRSEAA